MTQKEIKKLERSLEKLYDLIPEGTGLLDVVREIVDTEIILEAECGQ